LTCRGTVLLLVVGLSAALLGCETPQTASPKTQSIDVAPAPASRAFKSESWAVFFGAQADGQAGRIVYLVESSGSMQPVFHHVRAELLRSISKLRPGQAFGIILFSDRPPEATQGIAVGRGDRPGCDWVIPVTPSARKETADWLARRRARSAGGVTDPQPALRLALGCRPDAIFLLTDSKVPEGTVAMVRRLTADRRVPIHAIALVRNPGAEQLRELTAATGGSYRFIEQEELDAER
jgi:hypothetical protein